MKVGEFCQVGGHDGEIVRQFLGQALLGIGDLALGGRFHLGLDGRQPVRGDRHAHQVAAVRDGQWPFEPIDEAGTDFVGIRVVVPVEAVAQDSRVVDAGGGAVQGAGKDLAGRVELGLKAVELIHEAAVNNQLGGQQTLALGGLAIGLLTERDGGAGIEGADGIERRLEGLEVAVVALGDDGPADRVSGLVRGAVVGSDHGLPVGVGLPEGERRARQVGPEEVAGQAREDGGSHGVVPVRWLGCE